MTQLNKCCICNELITDGQSVPYRGRYVHQKCFNIAIKTLQKDENKQIDEVAEKKKRGRRPKPQAESKEALPEEEYEKKQQYHKYLRSIVEEQELSTRVYALTEGCIKRYSFTYETICQALVCLHEIIEKDLTGDIVGIIPYYYGETMQYYDSVNKVLELNKGVDVSNIYKKETIRVQPKKRKVKQIDIKSIRKGVD